MFIQCLFSPSGDDGTLRGRKCITFRHGTASSMVVAAAYAKAITVRNSHRSSHAGSRVNPASEGALTKDTGHLALELTHSLLAIS